MPLAGVGGSRVKQMGSVCGLSNCNLKQVDVVGLTEKVTSGQRLERSEGISHVETSEGEG